MVHSGRIFTVSAVRTRKELAERLVVGKVALCSGIYHSGFLFLNDSDADEGVRKFAVMRVESMPWPGRWELDQIKSIQTSGNRVDEVLGVINGLSEVLSSSRVIIQIDGPGHCCPLCA